MELNLLLALPAPNADDYGKLGVSAPVAAHSFDVISPASPVRGGN